jgi:predicted permease
LAQILNRALIALLTTEGGSLFVGLGLDLRMLGFTTAVAVFACLLFGLLPAFRATRAAPVDAMRAAGRGLTAGREKFALRRALVTAQVAMSLVLLVGAMLFAGSLRKLLAVDPGFNSEGLLSVSLDLRGAHFPKERWVPIQQDLEKRLGSSPGIVSAASVAITPISGSGWNNSTHSEAAPEGKESFYNRVGPDYIRTMGMTLIAGRAFTDRDDLSAPKVAIVNEAFAKRFYKDGNPVGKTFRVPQAPGKPDNVYQVAGLVRNTKYYELREEPIPIAFLPSAQEDDPGPFVTYMLRVAGSPRPAMESVKAAVATVNPNVIIEFRPLSSFVRDSLTRDRLMAVLAGAFGVLAGLLATIGLYGVIAYMVARRRNEIGVRIALGAGRGNVIGLVLREAVVLLGAGLVIGTGLALWATRAAEKLLFGLKPNDPLTFAATILLLAAVALLASYAPARRASKVEPMEALRAE